MKANRSSSILSNKAIDELIQEAHDIAGGDYKNHEATARNHAALQSRIIQVNGELIKTIRQLDAKNSSLQKIVAWLALVATVASVIALAK
jgi:hypothetical protein